MNKQHIFIILALTSYNTTLYAHPSQANEQGKMTISGTVLPQCSFVMLNNIPSINSNLAELIDSQKLPTDPILVSNPASTSIVTEKSIYESILVSNHQPIVKFQLIGNHGALTTICNTSSTLSVSIDKAATQINNSDVKIRFAIGGTGIYEQAHQDNKYQETIIFNSHGVTSATGDTALVEVNLPETNTNPIFVYASLTAQ